MPSWSLADHRENPLHIRGAGFALCCRGRSLCLPVFHWKSPDDIQALGIRFCKQNHRSLADHRENPLHIRGAGFALCCRGRSLCLPVFHWKSPDDIQALGIRFCKQNHRSSADHRENPLHIRGAGFALCCRGRYLCLPVFHWKSPDDIQALGIRFCKQNHRSLADHRENPRHGRDEGFSFRGSSDTISEGSSVLSSCRDS